MPTLVYANKQDLETAESRYEILYLSKSNKVPSADIAMVLKLHKLKDRAIQIQPCSAKTGEGVKDGLEWALKQVKSGK